MVKPPPPRNVTATWPTPNYVNPPTRSAAALLAATLCLTVVTVLIVGLRTYVRFFSLRAPGWDDYWIWISTLGAIGLCVTVNVSFNYGWDRHIWDQKPEWFETSELIQWVVQIHFVIIMTTAKISALCTYLRVAKGTKYRRFVWGTMVFIGCWGVAFLFATIFECNPIHLYWTSQDGKGCSNEDARLLIAVVINIITDLQVSIMPLPIVWKLQIPFREKVTLCVLMGLGIFAAIASVMRTVVMSQSLYTMRWDMTWNGMLVWIWLIIECDLAIICISIPVLRVLVRRFLPKWYPSMNSANMSKGGGHTSGGRSATVTSTSRGIAGANANGPAVTHQDRYSLASLVQERRLKSSHAEKGDLIELQIPRRSAILPPLPADQDVEKNLEKDSEKKFDERSFYHEDNSPKLT